MVGVLQGTMAVEMEVKYEGFRGPVLDGHFYPPTGFNLLERTSLSIQEM